MERWPSGLRRTLGKCVYPHRYRGFESHSLRQQYKLNIMDLNELFKKIFTIKNMFKSNLNFFTKCL